VRPRNSRPSEVCPVACRRGGAAGYSAPTSTYVRDSWSTPATDGIGAAIGAQATWEPSASDPPLSESERPPTSRRTPAGPGQAQPNVPISSATTPADRTDEGVAGRREADHATRH
jgi:hypothetical protein